MNEREDQQESTASRFNFSKEVKVSTYGKKKVSATEEAKGNRPDRVDGAKKNYIGKSEAQSSHQSSQVKKTMKNYLDSANKVLNKKIFNYNMTSSFTKKEREKQDQIYDEKRILENVDEIQKLKKLFTHYSNNEKHISSQKFKRLIEDADIVDSNFDYHYSDILFHKHSNKINFDIFCEVLVKIAEIKYPALFKENELQALQKIIYENFVPLFEMISEKNTNDGELHMDSLYGYMESAEFIGIVEKNFNILGSIYEKYFPWEGLSISQEEKRSLSEKSLFKFLNGFEISPHIISLLKVREVYENVGVNSGRVNGIFSTSNELHNEGTSFTLYHFIVSLFLLSAAAFHDGSFLVGISYAESTGIVDMSLIADMSCFNEIMKKLITSLSLNEVIDRKSLAKDHVKDERERIFSARESEYGIDKVMRSKESLDIQHIRTEGSVSTQGKELKRQSLYSLTEPDNMNLIKSETCTEINPVIYNAHKIILVDLFKYYANMSDLSSYTFIGYSSFLKFAKDINILVSSDSDDTVFTFPFNYHLKPTSASSKKGVVKTAKFTPYQLNSIFSKYSSEVPLKMNNLNRNKSKFMKEITVASSISNRRINFKEFMKILMCMAHSLVHCVKIDTTTEKNTCLVTERKNSPSPNSNSPAKQRIINLSTLPTEEERATVTARPTKHSKANASERIGTTTGSSKSNQYTKLYMSISQIMLLDTCELQETLDSFIKSYIQPIHSTLKAYLEKDLYDSNINENILNESNYIGPFLGKMKPVLLKVFESYSLDRVKMNFEEFMKFCKDFNIFPDLLSRPKLFQLFINLVEDFDIFITTGNNNFNIDFDKFIGLMIYCSLESNFIIEGNDCYRKLLLFFKRMMQSDGVKKTVRINSSYSLSQDFVTAFAMFNDSLKMIVDTKNNIRQENRGFKSIISKALN